MSLLWIPFTIMAAFMQSWRNALQKELRHSVNTTGVTLARFIVALPLAVIYLWCLYQYYPSASIPKFSTKFFSYIFIAAITQIMATIFMVMLFKARNYAIGVGLAKSEAVIAATLGAIFFAAPLSSTALLGVIIGGIAVWLMSLSHNPQSKNNSQLSIKTIAIGLASGLFFALCSLFIRESSLILRHDFGQNFVISASWTLFFVLFIQTLLLTTYLAITDAHTLKMLYKRKKLTALVSLFSFLGSVGWFTAMSLQSVALVKTLGQIEVLFTLAISVWWFKENLGRNDYLGLMLIVIGAVLVILA